MWFILFLISTTALTVSVILNFKLKRDKDELDVGKSHYKSKSKDLERQIEQLNNELQRIKKSNLDPINTSVAEPKPAVNLNKEEEVAIPQPAITQEQTASKEITWGREELKAKPETKKEFFFKGPIGDSQFLKNDASEEQRARFVYKIEVDDDGSRGELFLDPKHASDLDLIRNFPESILENACIYENAFKVDFKNLRQTSPGTVVSDGGHWKVTEKVKVRFE